MAYSNSGDRDKADRLISRDIPLLALGSVGMLLCYAVLILGGLGSGWFITEWLLAMLLLVFCVRAVLAEYTLLVRKAIFLFLATGVPLVLILFGVYTRNTLIVTHAFVLCGMCMIGWVLLEPLVAQCTGHTDSMIKYRRQLESDPSAAQRMRKPAGLAFSGDALVALILAGTLVFSLGEYLRQGQEYPIFPPTLFALAFYLCAGALISLSKLAQRVQEIPGSVRVEPGFARTWVSGMLAVLVVCGLLALLLPKAPIMHTARWMAERTQDSTARFDDTPWHSPPPGDGHPSQRAPFGGQGTNPAPGVGRVPRGGRTPGGGETRPPANDRALDFAYKVVTAFEKGGAGGGQPSADNDGQPGEDNGSQGGGNARGSGETPGQNGGQGEGGQGDGGSGNQPPRAGQQPADERQQTPPASSTEMKSERLKQALEDNPARWLKLLAAGLLGLVVLLGAVMLVLIMVRRHIWYLLANLLRQLGGWLRGKVSRALAPFFARLAQQRREHRIQAIMQHLHLFDDPFAHTAGRSGGELSRAAYAAFLAHMWLLGYERRPADTEFLFATRLCDAGLAEKPVWAITMGYVRAEFSPTPLNDAELAEMRQALQQIAEVVNTRLADDTRRERIAGYCRLLAERQIEQGEISKEPVEEGQRG